MSSFRRKLLISHESEEPVDPTLIFFAPLSYGDLTDHISGNMLNNYSTLMSWNSSEQMYYVEQTYSYTDCPYWDVDFTNVFQKTSNQQFTFVVDGRSMVSSRYNYPVFFSLGYYTASYGPPAITVDGWHETNKTDFKRRAIIFDGTDLYRYANSLLTEKNSPNSSSGWRVSNWLDQSFQKVCINPYRHPDGAGIDLLLKNIRIYNRVLTIEEVMSLPY